jgi:hypothetical protein
MKEILQFESGDLNATMAWYLTGKVTMRQLVEALNIILRDKAEASRDQEEQTRPVHRPSCF